MDHSFAAENQRLRSEMEKIVGHLSAIIIQKSSRNDEIIIGHVADAYHIALAAIQRQS